MALNIKYNVYYSTSVSGPWTLANTTPVIHSDLGNQYTVTGLVTGTLYYFLIIGGHIVNNEFIQLTSQHIGPDGSIISSIGTNSTPHISAKPFAPKRNTIQSLGHSFAVAFSYVEDFEDGIGW